MKTMNMMNFLKRMDVPGLGRQSVQMMPQVLSILMHPAKSDVQIADAVDWAAEKDDILERANWLCHEIIGKPEDLVKKMPALLGEEFQGQWAIYNCSMLCHALANISRLYPDQHDKCLPLMAQLIDMVNTPVIRNYDTMKWHEDAIKGLPGHKSHMTYLSILAWMITDYRMSGGDGRYDSLLDALCEGLDRRIEESKFDMNLLSFPHTPIFVPDMLVSIVALHNYSLLHDGKYEDTVQAWLRNAKTKWCHRGTGLLASKLQGESRRQVYMTPLGSYTALSCSYLSLVDPAFARDQYNRLKRYLYGEAEYKGTKVYGIREYLNKSPELSFGKGDAGLIIKGLSTGASAFVLGACTMFGDWELRSKILRTADIAGGTIKEERMRHYRLAEIFMVGEATALAMRTNIPY